MDHATRSSRPTQPTSPTAPTTSSASTTCATTWSTRPATRVQRGLNFAIVDEVDSILIDEARTPLIISGQAEDHTELYVRINELLPLLDRQNGEEKADGEGVEKPGDFTVDEKARQVFLTEAGPREGRAHACRVRACSPRAQASTTRANITLMHHLYAALRAQHAVPPRPALRGAERRGVIVDEFTGRMMTGRRWSRRPAPGRGGEGRRQDPEREPDARLDHVPELLPPVREARRHDRHGRHRSLRIPARSTAWKRW